MNNTDPDLMKIQLVVRFLQDQRNTALNAVLDKNVELTLVQKQLEELQQKVQQMHQIVAKQAASLAMAGETLAKVNEMLEQEDMLAAKQLVRQYLVDSQPAEAKPVVEQP